MIGFRGVLGGFGGVLRGLGGLRGVCLTPKWHFFSPLEVLYGTRFGSKHHMMVPLAQVSKVGITDPFPDLWSPPRGSQKANISANTALLRPQ